MIMHIRTIRHCRIRKQVRGEKKFKKYSLTGFSRSVDLCIISRVEFIGKFSSHSLRDRRKLQECRICKYEIDELASVDIKNPHEGAGAALANYESEDEVAGT